MDNPQPRLWTEEELLYLEKNYPYKTTKELAKDLNRSYSSTKIKLKLIKDLKEKEIPLGFKKISDTPQYCVNEKGIVLNNRSKRILKPNLTGKGYLTVDIKGKRRAIHRLVATMFIPNPEGLPQVNHLDGDKTNNRVENLEWCTNTQNREHAIKTGLWDNISEKVSNSQQGVNNSNSKLTEENVKEIRILISQKVPLNTIALQFNVSRSTISNIKLNKTYQSLK